MHFLGNSGQVDRREAPRAVIQMKAASKSPLPLRCRCRRRSFRRSSHRSSFFRRSARPRPEACFEEAKSEKMPGGSDGHEK